MVYAISRITNQEDRAILEQLFTEHFNSMLHAAMKIISNKADAEDVVVNAALSLFDKASFLQSLPPHKCAAYMVRTAKRQAFNTIRLVGEKASQHWTRKWKRFPQK